MRFGPNGSGTAVDSSHSTTGLKGLPTGPRRLAAAKLRTAGARHNPPLGPPALIPSTVEDVNVVWTKIGRFMADTGNIGGVHDTDGCWFVIESRSWCGAVGLEKDRAGVSASVT